MASEKKKTSHQIRWEAYKERRQERIMRNEQYNARRERRERMRETRKRTGSALASAFAVILAFIVISVFIFGVDVLNHGTETITELSEGVYLHSYRFNSLDDPANIMNEGFSVLAQLGRLTENTLDWFRLVTNTSSKYCVFHGNINGEKVSFITPARASYGFFEEYEISSISNGMNAISFKRTLFSRVSLYDSDGNFISTMTNVVFILAQYTYSEALEAVQYYLEN